jgi:hypothetical protein
MLVIYGYTPSPPFVSGMHTMGYRCIMHDGTNKTMKEYC